VAAESIAIQIVGDVSGLQRSFAEAKRQTDLLAAGIKSVQDKIGQNSWGKGIDAASVALAKVRAEALQAQSGANILSSAMASLNLRMKEGTVSQAEFKAASAKLNQEFRKTATEAGDAGNRIRGIGSSLGGIGPLVAGAFSVGGVVAFGRALLDSSLAAEKLQRTLTFAAGSKIAGAEDLEYLRATANKLGLDVRSAGEAFAGLSAAARGTALAGQPAREVFEAVAGASTVMGLSAEQTQGALLALQQMMSKGTVQSEELRGQLGERLPGAFAIAARAVGKTTAELGKMLESGQVMSDEFLPKFAAELKRSVSADLPAATRSMNAEINRMKNDWDMLLQSFASGGGMQAATEGIKSLSNGLQIVSRNMDVMQNASLAIGETVLVTGAVVGAARLVALARAFDVAKVSALALTSNPVILAFAAAFAGGMYLANRRVDEMNSGLKLMQVEADRDRIVINDMQKALDRVNASGGDAKRIKDVAYAYRTGALSAKEASKAAMDYAGSLEAANAKAASAKALLAGYLPPSEKVREQLKKLEEAQLAANEKDKLTTQEFSAAKAKIIEDGYKQQVAVRNEILKQANEQELSAENVKIAAVIELQKTRMQNASGNLALIAAAERASAQQVTQIMLAGELEKSKAARESALSRVKSTEDALAKSLDAEKRFAARIIQLQDAISGIQQSAADKISEIRRKGMTESQAEASRQEEIARKFAESEELLKKGEAAAAVEIAKKAEALAMVSTNLAIQEKAVRRAAEVEVSARMQEKDAAEQALAAQRVSTEALSASLRVQKSELDKVSAAVSSLDQRLASPRALDINTAPALFKIAEVKRELASIANATLLSSGGDSGGIVSMPEFAAGGLISGPGTGTSDSIAARVSSGEYIVRAAAVDRYGARFLDSINRMSVPKFAAGGLVGGGGAGGLVGGGGAGGITLNVNVSGGNPQSIISAIKQALRTDPGLLSVANVRAG